VKYKLLVFDVDGTLIGRDGIVPPETIDAIAQIASGGVRICLATGRSYAETMPIWRQLNLKPPLEPMIVIGGAMVSEPTTGRTLYQQTIEHDLADQYSQALCQAGHSAMAIVDSWRHGVDYYLCEGPDSHLLDKLWFSKMNVTVRRLARLDAAMPPVLRINCVTTPQTAEALAGQLVERFAGRLNIHSIFAPNYGVTIVEAFASRASKWAGVMYVAQAYRIKPSQIVCFGDDVNDISMLRSAGLGVAMPWANQAVQSVAKAIALPNLAQFIRSLAAGGITTTGTTTGSKN
jgi:Cof subfamily protein (haloacid dehalogenase superfamily)